jgi:hypothetical protein
LKIFLYTRLEGVIRKYAGFWIVDGSINKYEIYQQKFERKKQVRQNFHLNINSNSGMRRLKQNAIDLL